MDTMVFPQWPTSSPGPIRTIAAGMASFRSSSSMGVPWPPGSSTATTRPRSSSPSWASSTPLPLDAVKASVRPFAVEILLAANASVACPAPVRPVPASTAEEAIAVELPRIRSSPAPPRSTSSPSSLVRMTSLLSWRSPPMRTSSPPSPRTRSPPPPASMTLSSVLPIDHVVMVEASRKPHLLDAHKSVDASIVHCEACVEADVPGSILVERGCFSRPRPPAMTSRPGPPWRRSSNPRPP